MPTTNDPIDTIDEEECFFGLDAEQIPEEQLAHVTGGHGGRFAHPSEATTIPAAFYK